MKKKSAGKNDFLKKKKKKEGKIILFNYQWKSKPKSWRKRFFFFFYKWAKIWNIFFSYKIKYIKSSTVIPQFDWLCDVCGCVMSPTSSIYWVDLGFINNYKEPQLWLVILRYSADVASAFPWVVTYGIRAGPVIPCGLRDTTPQSGP